MPLLQSLKLNLMIHVPASASVSCLVTSALSMLGSRKSDLQPITTPINLSAGGNDGERQPPSEAMVTTQGRARFRTWMVQRLPARNIPGTADTTDTRNQSHRSLRTRGISSCPRLRRSPVPFCEAGKAFFGPNVEYEGYTLCRRPLQVKSTAHER